MLILSRNVGESIHIGTDIKLTVLEKDGRQVRIGIAAPKVCAGSQGRNLLQGKTGR